MSTLEKRCGLVLSGGGAMGVAHLGVMEEFAQAGYRFDWFVGVSAGAIVAAAYASGLSIDQIWSELKSSKILRTAFDLPLGRSGVLRGTKVYEAISGLLGDRTFDQLSTSLAIGVTDFTTGDPIFVREGKVVDAVQGSITVPGLFEPWRLPALDRWVVDGGLSNNLPIGEALRSYSGERIVAVDVATGLRPFDPHKRRHIFRRARSIAGVLNQSIRIMLKAQQNEVELNHPRVIVIRPDLAYNSAFDIRHFDIMRRKGVEAARATLATLTE